MSEPLSKVFLSFSHTAAATKGFLGERSKVLERERERYIYFFVVAVRSDGYIGSWDSEGHNS